MQAQSAKTPAVLRKQSNMGGFFCRHRDSRQAGQVFDAGSVCPTLYCTPQSKPKMGHLCLQALRRQTSWTSSWCRPSLPKAIPTWVDFLCRHRDTRQAGILRQTQSVKSHKANITRVIQLCRHRDGRQAGQVSGAGPVPGLCAQLCHVPHGSCPEPAVPQAGL